MRGKHVNQADDEIVPDMPVVQRYIADDLICDIIGQETDDIDEIQHHVVVCIHPVLALDKSIIVVMKKLAMLDGAFHHPRILIDHLGVFVIGEGKRKQK